MAGEEGNLEVSDIRRSSLSQLTREGDVDRVRRFLDFSGDESLKKIKWIVFHKHPDFQAFDFLALFFFKPGPPSGPRLLRFAEGAPLCTSPHVKEDSVAT